MASSEDPEPKIEAPLRQPGDPVLVQHNWVKRMQRELYEEGINPNWFGSKDWVRIHYYKKNPPPIGMRMADSHENPGVTDMDLRIAAAEELSLEICEMFNHLHISPSTKHITNTLSNLQKKLTVSMIRMAIRGLNSAIIKHDSTL